MIFQRSITKDLNEWKDRKPNFWIREKSQTQDIFLYL